MHKKLCIHCTILCARCVCSLPYLLGLLSIPSLVKRGLSCLVLDITIDFRKHLKIDHLNSERADKIAEKSLSGTKVDISIYNYIKWLYSFSTPYGHLRKGTILRGSGVVSADPDQFHQAHLKTQEVCLGHGQALYPERTGQGSVL